MCRETGPADRFFWNFPRLRAAWVAGRGRGGPSQRGGPATRRDGDTNPIDEARGTVKARERRAAIFISLHPSGRVSSDSGKKMNENRWPACPAVLVGACCRFGRTRNRSADRVSAHWWGRMVGPARVKGAPEVRAHKRNRLPCGGGATHQLIC